MTKKLPGTMLITVCDVCFRACCWQGKLLCEESIRKRAIGTMDIPIKALRKLKRESPDYWEDDPHAKEWRIKKGLLV